MDYVRARIVRVEVSRDEDIGGRLLREAAKNLGVCGWLLPAEEEGSAQICDIAVRFLVAFELLVVLLLVLLKVVFDFGKLLRVSLACLKRVALRTSPSIAYQCASEANMARLLSTFMTPIDFVTCSTSLSSPSSSGIDSGPLLRS
jgi:hypothetical protein